MNWYLNLRLGLKISLLIVLAIGGFGGTVLLLISTSTTGLIDTVGHLRAEQEIVVIDHHITAAQEELETSANLLINTPGFIDAAADEDKNHLQALLFTVLSARPFGEFVMMNPDGEIIIDIQQADEQLGEQEIALLRQGLLGIQRVTLNAKADADKALLQFSLIRPVRDNTATIVGAMLLTRTLDDSFLSEINLERAGVTLSLIYADQVVSNSYGIGDAANNEINAIDSLPVNTALVNQALGGRTLINPDIVYLDTNNPITEVYLPVSGLNDTVPHGVVVIRIENNTIALFRQQLVNGLILSLGVLLLIVISFVLLVVRYAVANRLRKLQKATIDFAQEKYEQPVTIQGQDEIGQMTHAFNQMVSTIQHHIADVEAALERAERSEQVRSAFLASMSHELRTPLNAIINFSKFVAQGDLGPVNEGQEETLFEVVNSANHLLSLINDVLDMSKIDSGTLNLFIEDGINLADILGRVAVTGQGLVGSKPVEIRTEIASDLPSIRGDRQRLFQIFLNVMSNAVKFTDEGHITVKAKCVPDGDEILIAISDTGAGIAADEQAQVFDAFKQTRSGLRQGGGTGLGMPISKNLAEAHGGRLWLESEPDVGTTFFVVLPIQSANLVPTLATRKAEVK